MKNIESHVRSSDLLRGYRGLEVRVRTNTHTKKLDWPAPNGSTGSNSPCLNLLKTGSNIRDFGGLGGTSKGETGMLITLAWIESVATSANALLAWALGSVSGRLWTVLWVFAVASAQLELWEAQHRYGLAVER